MAKKLEKETIEKIALSALGGAALLFGFIQLGIKPKLANIKKYGQEIDEIRPKVEQARRYARAGGRLRNSIEDFRMEIEKLEADMPREADTAWFLNLIKGVTAVSEVRPDAWKPVDMGVENPEDPYIERKARLSISCGYHEFGSFLNELEIRSRHVNVEEFVLKGNGPKPVRAEFLVNYMVLREGQGVKKAEEGDASPKAGARPGARSRLRKKR